MKREKIILAVVAITLVFTVLFTSLQIISFNRLFYQEKFDQYGVYTEFEGNKTLVDNEFDYVLSYLEGSEKEIKSTFYNEKEKRHLKDVKQLFQTARVLLWLSIGLLVMLGFYLLRIEQMSVLLRGLILGSASLLGLILLLLVSVILQFNASFVVFHKLLFSNNLWILNPATDNLINLLPQQIFYDLAFKLAVIIILISTLVLIGSYVIKRYWKQNASGKN